MRTYATQGGFLAAKAKPAKETYVMSATQKPGVWLAILLLIVWLTHTFAFAAKTQTLTGVVGDAMCGAKHTMRGSDADCLRTCVNMGSKYALIVGDKVYALETNDKTVLSQLEELSAQRATVTGEVDHDTIVVTSVAPAR